MKSEIIRLAAVEKKWFDQLNGHKRDQELCQQQYQAANRARNALQDLITASEL